MDVKKEALLPENTPSNPDVVTKLKAAGEIANKVIRLVSERCVADAKVFDLCIFGDEKIVEETSNLYKKSKEKGVAFPTTICINNCVCHYSPLNAEEPILVLKDGDLVKIELGVHFEGFPALVGHTLVVGATKENPTTGKKADAIVAARIAGEAIMRLLKAGTKTSEIPAITDKVAQTFGCKSVEGFTSHQILKNTIDGEKTIYFSPNDSQRKDMKTSILENNEIYTIDILMSTGEGKAKPLEARTTLYKRTSSTYLLKMKTSRALFSEISSKFGYMVFNLRAIEDEKKARMGLTECVSHGLVNAYEVYYEKENEQVALFKYTALISATGTTLITTPDFHQDLVKSEITLQDEVIQKLLSEEIGKKKAPKKKKKTAGASSEKGKEKEEEEDE